MIDTAALLFFPLLMAFAAFSDLLTMRISNRLVLVLAAGFVATALIVNMNAQEFALHVAAGAVVLMVAFTFFAMRWIGGGDAKLAAATTMWLGFGVALPFLVYAALLGGVLTLAILSLRRWPLPAALIKVDWITRLHDQNEGVPYGIALAAAGLITYSNTAIFHRLAGA